MAKRKVNKSEEIRTVFSTTPTASAKEVVSKLAEKGITVAEGLVYSVKQKLKPSKKKKGPKATASAKVAAPVRAAAAASSNGVLSVGASIAIARTAAEKIGGWAALKEIADAMV